MKYFVCEGVPNGKYNASSKARNDVEFILKNNGIIPKFVETKNCIQERKIMKWKQILIYFNNKNKWIKFCKSLKKGDIVIIQYPILNILYGLDKVIQKFKAKGITFIALIHDLDSIRCNALENGKTTYKRICNDDKKILNSVNYIISHNSFMTKELIKLGNESEKIVNLDLFDYIIDFIPKKINRSKTNPLIIAGNLSPIKARYLLQLKTIKNLNFNLYGVGFNEDISNNNIFYKGKYKPDELIDHLEGSFGLVWDGQTIKTCSGGYGNYLRYNNPHKASLYLTAGIPIIVWDKSALAKFVIDNGVGLTVSSLNDIEEKINNLSEKQYKEMIENAKKISKKTIKGIYLMSALDKILKK